MGIVGCPTSINLSVMIKRSYCTVKYTAGWLDDKCETVFVCLHNWLRVFRLLMSNE